MSIGKYLQSKENLELVRRFAWSKARPQILAQGMAWYRDHPEEGRRIAENLRRVGLPSDEDMVARVQSEIVAHYFEKLFALVKRYEVVWLVRNKVEVGDAMEVFARARSEGKAVFVAQSHFGATYLLGSVLMVHGFDIHMVGNFPEPVGSLLQRSAGFLHERYGLGAAHLINLADPDTDAPMEMLKCLVTKRIVSNVFDENNAFSRPVSFMGTTVFGGSGMDQILKNFSDDRVVLVTPFLIRTGDDTFRYEVDVHSFDQDIIASFYRSLERRVRTYPEQWYFLHELHESFVDKRPQARPPAG